MIRFLAGLLAATVVAHVMIAFTHSQFVHAALRDVGAEIPLGLSLATSVADIAGMASVLLPALLVGFLIAFTIGVLVERFVFPAGARVGYALAGALAVAVLLGILNQLFSTTILAGAREMLGYLMMLVSGAVAGAVFGLIHHGARPGEAAA